MIVRLRYYAPRIWARALVAAWRARRLERDRARRRELTAAIGPLSGNWIQSHYYTSGQRRERD